MLEEIDNEFYRFQEQRNKILNIRPMTSRAKRGSDNDEFNQNSDINRNNNSTII